MKSDWKSWDRSLVETEIFLESKFAQLTKYEESFGIEFEALSKSLHHLASRLDDVNIEQLDEEDLSNDPVSTTAILKKCQVI